MKTNNEKRLTEKEMWDQTAQTLIDTTCSLNLDPQVLGEFFRLIRKNDKKTFSLLNQIEYGIDEYCSKHSSPYYTMRKEITRTERIRYISLLTTLGLQFQIDAREKFVNGQKIGSEILSKKFLDSRKTIQLCFLYQITQGGHPEAIHLRKYQEVVKMMRDMLEVNRMELHLSGQPTYTYEIKHVNLFIKILEEAVKIGDRIRKDR